MKIAEIMLSIIFPVVWKTHNASNLNIAAMCRIPSKTKTKGIFFLFYLFFFFAVPLTNTTTRTVAEMRVCAALETNKIGERTGIR